MNEIEDMYRGLIAFLWILLIAIATVCFIGGFTIGYTVCKHYNKPVYTNTVVDSIKQENNTLILEVEHLDSLKNADIIKVQAMDNDSTINLFYQLISE